MGTIKEGITMNAYRVDLYCDGSCQGNFGPGGYAYTLVAKPLDSNQPIKTLHASDYSLATSQQRIQILAVITALQDIKRKTDLQVITHAPAIIDGIAWALDWKANNFRSKTGTPTHDAVLWLTLLRLAKPHTITWQLASNYAACDAQTALADAVQAEAFRQRRIAETVDHGQAVSIRAAADESLLKTTSLVTANGATVTGIDYEAPGYRLKSGTSSIFVHPNYRLYKIAEPS